mmetsp:Transcript_4639/g.11343  ORF Transcript_4639/g.11343 Transcript_4639/m.11343 type:complete len:158 (+) Transcript_4639:931-1404(+)
MKLSEERAKSSLPAAKNLFRVLSPAPPHTILFDIIALATEPPPTPGTTIRVLHPPTSAHTSVDIPVDALVESLLERVPLEGAEDGPKELEAARARARRDIGRLPEGGGEMGVYLSEGLARLVEEMEKEMKGKAAWATEEAGAGRKRKAEEDAAEDAQ